MNRDEMIGACKRNKNGWDVVIIGGGATGLGAALDAASRGFTTLLLEQNDFAKGTSSRSTKLIHGGLRYLKQGNISLVREALIERGLLCQNAPHLVSHLPFLIPHYHLWEVPYYRIGMKVYDLMAGKLGIEKSHGFNSKEALVRIPNLEPHHLCGGTVYYDGQFDDARLSVSLAQTAVDHGGVLINYMPVISFVKKEGKVIGVIGRDEETKEELQIKAKCVINATGVYSDMIRKMDDPNTHPIMAPSQGIHLVLPRSFMPTDLAVLIPKTKDGRLLFCVPWHHQLLVGTTDTPVNSAEIEPKPLEEEIDYLLEHVSHYLVNKPQRKDVLSIFTGLRPLVRKGGKLGASLARNHEILTSPSNLITIVGGKWTTYRKMGEEVIDRAIQVGSLKKTPCQTKHLKLHGYEPKQHSLDTWKMYGSDTKKLEDIIEKHPHLNQLIHPKLPYKLVEVVWACRYEMARTLEDVLARRTRSLFLNAAASLEVASKVASLMAAELGKDKKWEEEQTLSFQKQANNYLCKVG
jgi:glycerol-3-phosphate dehydrogenase